jgi:hypothetical protein
MYDFPASYLEIEVSGEELSNIITMALYSLHCEAMIPGGMSRLKRARIVPPVFVHKSTTWN